LVVVEPGDSGLETDEAFPLTAITTVGRSPDNTVRVSDGTVSSNHGRLIHQGHNWILEDLDSTNGTYVNGKRIAGRVRVNYGDILSFGGVSLKLVRE
jgi:pSer/pThr/pTyr-binding forkhead associated (FHA) protein